MKNQKKSVNILLGIVAVGVLALASSTFYLKDKNIDAPVSPDQVVSETKAVIASDINEGGDLVIPLSEITTTASFYQYNKLANPMEIIAVKASDGSIRTAFNTCQICFSSGRGYYEQDGNNLVCQNCGNRFTMDEIQVTKGGCNPVPIDADNKTVTDTEIIIPRDLLEEADEIFENWKL